MAKKSSGISSEIQIQDIDEYLINYYNDKVRIKPDARQKHELIALTFVNDFAQFVRSRVGLSVSFVGQGSAFEEINVGAADEFDFLIMLTRNGPADASEAADYIRRDLAKFKASDCGYKCYYPITLPAHFMAIAKENDFYYNAVETWPYTNIDCLSAANAIELFKIYLTAFDRWVQKTDHEIHGVAKIDLPELHRPALTTHLKTTNGSRISIDISIAIRSLTDDNKFEFYIAKPKQMDDEELDRRINLLWLKAYSQDELLLIKKKTKNQKTNYCIAKSLFTPQINSYILKTIFMSQTLCLSDKPGTFVEQMLRALQRALYAELDRRNLHPTGQHRGSLLTSRFNACENILARYDNGRLRQMYDWVRKVYDESNTEMRILQLIAVLYTY